MKKNILRYIMLISILLISTNCKDSFFNSEPGNVILGDDLDKVDPAAGLNGMYAYLYKYDTLNRGDDVLHCDFGYMHLVLASELWGQDMVQYTDNYGWYYTEYQLDIRTRSFEYVYCLIHWNFFYKLIKAANEVLLATSGDETKKEDHGQALGMRAFAYLNLVQLYQFTYKGHENAPAVPIVLETNTLEELSSNPRATVTQVYKQIQDDLEQAYEELKGFDRPNATIIDQSVICGLLARMYLVKEDWSNAEKYAIEARNSYDSPESKSLLIDEGFVDMNRHTSWMWTSNITIDADIVESGIINYISHISSVSYGYTTAGAMYKNISSELYDKIPESDIRKEWFCSEETVVTDGPMAGVVLPKYANLKYGWYDVDGNNCNDYCYMRAEEMWLIEAEAKAMGGNPGGAKMLLETFVKTRQPDYACQANSPEELQDEIWLQRRIEFWGEGLAFFDLKRLKKPIIRKYDNTNHNKNAWYNLPAEHDIFNLMIPRREIQDNNGITSSDNNPLPSLPELED